MKYFASAAVVLAAVAVGKIILPCLKYALLGLLAMAAVIAVQGALAGVVGFPMAERFGKTAMTVLFWYAVLRMLRGERRAA